MTTVRVYQEAIFEHTLKILKRRPDFSNGLKSIMGENVFRG